MEQGYINGAFNPCFGWIHKAKDRCLRFRL